MVAVKEQGARWVDAYALALAALLALVGCQSQEGSGTPFQGAAPGTDGGGVPPAPCAINADCDLGVCDTASGECVECVGTTDCAPGETCEGRSCVAPPACESDLDCTDAVASRCFSQTDSCVQCVSSADCDQEDVCDQNQFCVPSPTCVNSLDCAKGVCDQRVGRCTDCLADPDCPEEFRCGNGDCQPACDSDNDCKPRGLLCDFAKGYCVECVQSADCAADRFCQDGTCRADLCEAGETKCDEGDVVTCPDDGSGFVLSTPCDLNQTCADEGGLVYCKDHICSPDSTRCSSSTEELLRCASDGLGATVEEDCAESGGVCLANACAPVICTVGEYVCVGTMLTTCVDEGTAQESVQDCSLGATYCSASTGSCEPIACTPNLSTCNGDTLRVCDAVGAGYTETDCAASGKSCVDVIGEEPRCETTVCAPSSYFCKDGHVHLCATDGQSSTLFDTCLTSQYCLDGDASCNSDVCTAGTKSCSGTTVRTCRADGSGYDVGVDCASTGQVCSGGTCLTPVCTPNTYFCSDGNVVRCSSNGLSWSNYDTCSIGEYCTPGDSTCNADVCPQGQPACDGNILTTCNADGSGYASGGYDCTGVDQICWTGGCQTPVCTQNAYFCLAGDVHRCAASGLSSSVYDNCTASEFCSDGDSSCNPQICTPDQPACNGNLLTTCNSDGSGFLAGGTDCTATSQVCADAICQAAVCTPGEYFCSGGHVQLCSDDAVNYTQVDTCNSLEFCTNGDSTCNPDICEQGQPTCDGATATTCNADGSGYAGAATDCSLGSAPDGPYCRMGVCTDTLFLENFEDGDYTAAIDTVGAVWYGGSYHTKAVTTDQSAGGTAYSLYMEKGSNSSTYYFYTNVSPMIAPKTVSWWIRPGSLYVNHNYFVLRTSSSTSSTSRLLTHYCASGGLMTLQTGSGNVTQGFEIDTWYHIELRNINWVNGTYDYYVDGVLRAAAQTFEATGSGIGRVDIYHVGAYATGYWDEIVMR